MVIVENDILIAPYFMYQCQSNQVILLIAQCIKRQWDGLYDQIGWHLYFADTDNNEISATSSLGYLFPTYVWY